jgi:hypothetical protein
MREARQSLKWEKIRRKKWGKKPMTKKEEKRFICESIDFSLGDYSIIPRRKGEKQSYWLGRYEDFRSWLIGDRIGDHISVEDWARKEFKKQRKRIRQLI